VCRTRSGNRKPHRRRGGGSRPRRPCPHPGPQPSRPGAGHDDAVADGLAAPSGRPSRPVDVLVRVTEVGMRVPHATAGWHPSRFRAAGQPANRLPAATPRHESSARAGPHGCASREGLRPSRPQASPRTRIACRVTSALARGGALPWRRIGGPGPVLELDWNLDIPSHPGFGLEHQGPWTDGSRLK
jgi:hypothetical protein